MRAWIGALALSAGAAAQSLPKFNERLMRQAMDAHMKDAESARFRSVRQQASSEHPGAWIICGEVNAKNAYGGYAGYSPFLAVVGQPKGKPASYVLLGRSRTCQRLWISTVRREVLLGVDIGALCLYNTPMPAIPARRKRRPP